MSAGSIQQKGSSKKVVGVIPARYGSSRFPGKVLVPIDGIPMVAHVYLRAKKSKLLDELLVATDNGAVVQSMESLDIPVIMTASSHRSGTERVAEVAEKGDGDIYVNIQGDEPFIESEIIDNVAEQLLWDEDLRMSTVGSTALTNGEWSNPDVTKVRVDKDFFALDFFRIPDSDQVREGCHKHIGLYGYARDFLRELAELKPTRREMERDLEQMRALDHGVPIKVVITDYDSIGINTSADLQQIREVLGVA